MSTRAENQFALHEREREAWEFNNCPEGEKQEMVEIYISRGLAPDKAQAAVDAMATNAGESSA